MILGVFHVKKKKLLVHVRDYLTRDGIGELDIIHVCKLALAHLSVMKFVKSEDRSLVSNVGIGKGAVVLEVIHCFGKIANAVIGYEFVDKRSGDIALSVADSSSRSHELKWSTSCSLDAMCEVLWSCYFKNSKVH